MCARGNDEESSTPPSGFSYSAVLQDFRLDIAPNSNPSGRQGDGWNVVYAIVNSTWGTGPEPFEDIYEGVLDGAQTILSGQPNPFIRARNGAELTAADSCQVMETL
jgi:hypothetical protein